MTLENMISKAIKYELSVVESVDKNIVGIENIVIRMLLLIIRYDSQKHFELYNAILELIRAEPKAVSEEVYLKLKDMVETHIKYEEEMLKVLSTLKKEVSDKRVIYILDLIAEDEHRHHTVLKSIHNTLVRGETVSEEYLWETLWREAPFHGAPGG